MEDLKGFQHGRAVKQLFWNSKGVLVIEDSGRFPKHLLIHQKQRYISVLGMQFFGEL